MADDYLINAGNYEQSKVAASQWPINAMRPHLRRLDVIYRRGLTEKAERDRLQVLALREMRRMQANGYSQMIQAEREFVADNSDEWLRRKWFNYIAREAVLSEPTSA